MRIPTTDETIKRLMGSCENTPKTERTRMKDGPPLFTRKDILEARNRLDIELRAVFNEYEIGKTYFNETTVDYFQTVEGHPKAQAKSDTQNLIRTLERGGITDRRFEETLRALGFEILDRSVTVKDPAGDIKTFSTSRILADLQKNC